MLGRDRCFALLEAALATCQCDQAEVILTVTDQSLTRFAESMIHQNMVERNARIVVRAVVGKRIGVARGNQLSPKAVQSVARRAQALAPLSTPDPEFVSLPKPAPLPKVRSFAEATANSTPEERVAQVRRIVEVAQEQNCTASGSISAETSEIAIGNSLGVRAYAPVTHARMMLVVADDHSSGYAAWQGLDISQLNPRASAEIAVHKCVAGRGAQSLDPGEYPVILEPLAVGDMLNFLSRAGFGATAYQEGRSFLSGRLGEKAMGENVAIWDDATDPRSLTFPFDWEGVPKRKLMLIENGVARSVVYDSYTAAKDQTTSTGHALPAPSIHGPSPSNLFLGAGTTSREEMLASTARGLLVTRFHYTNIIHEKQAIITGMTRDGTFLIENGKIVRPVQNLRFTQSILAALSNIELLGRECQLTGGGYVPAVKIGKFSFTS